MEESKHVVKRRQHLWFAFRFYFLLPLLVGIMLLFLFFPPWHAQTNAAWFYTRIIIVMLFIYVYLAWNTV